MTRIVTTLAAALAALLMAPGVAVAFPQVGMGEQDAGIFSDPHWLELGLNDVRLVVGWDATSTKWQRNELDPYMRAAKETGTEVMVAFGRSRVSSRNRVLPTVAAFRREFRRFRSRYPHVTTFVTWNEANHCSQPTCHRPDMAAAYYNMLRSVCGTCTIVAADVLDLDDMVQWITEFQQRAKSGPKIWGLHNYIDANRFRTSGTRALLAATKGEVWFTETGGLVRRRNTSAIPFPDSVAHAAKATRFVFNNLVPLSPRIKRVYLYHWKYAGPHAKLGLGAAGSAWTAAARVQGAGRAAAQARFVRRAGTAALVAAALIAAGGCGADRRGIGQGGFVEGQTLSVYASLPRALPGARDMVDGAKLALADAQGRAGEWKVNLAVLDDSATRAAAPMSRRRSRTPARRCATSPPSR